LPEAGGMEHGLSKLRTVVAKSFDGIEVEAERDFDRDILKGGRYAPRRADSNTDRVILHAVTSSSGADVDAVTSSNLSLLILNDMGLKFESEIHV
jgi:hypothetical protein